MPEDEPASPTEVTDEKPPTRARPLAEWASNARVTRQARVRAKQVVRAQVPAGSRASFRVDILSMLLAGLYTGAVFPFVNVIARDDLKASPELLALITAAPFLGNLLAMFWARAMEGQRKVPWVVGSWGAARLVVMLSLFAVGAWPFALVISLAQIIGTIATPAYAAVIKEVYPDDQRGRIVSLTRAAIIAAQMVSTLIAGWLLSSTAFGPLKGYQVVFPVAAIVGVAGAWIYSRVHPGESAMPREEAPEDQKSGPLDGVKGTLVFVWGTLGILKTDVAYRWFALSVFTYGFGNLLNLPILPLLQVDELHIAKWQVSLFTILTQVTMVGSYFFWGRFVDRRSPQLAVVVNIVLTTLISVVYIATGTVLPANAWWLVPAFLISGIVNAGIDIAYFSALLTFAGDRDVSRYQALQSFLLGVRGSIAPFIGSAMVGVLRAHQLNLRWIFVVSIVLILAGAWMQNQAMRRQRGLISD